VFPILFVRHNRVWTQSLFLWPDDAANGDKVINHMSNKNSQNCDAIAYLVRAKELVIVVCTLCFFIGGPVAIVNFHFHFSVKSKWYAYGSSHATIVDWVWVGLASLASL